MINDLKKVFTLFTNEVADMNLSQLDLDGISIRLPHFQKEALIDLCNKTKEIFKNEDILLNLRSTNTYIIGDLHGNLFDVLRILKNIGLPNEKQATYIFLGDIVDRGEFSLETVLVIFLMKLLYPQNVYVIRGNHEFDSTCNEGGFKDDIIKFYDLDTYNSFLDVFSYLPLGALVNNQVFCVHGGIGPNFHSLSQITQIKRPINDYKDDDILISLLWSDPEENIQDFRNSYRGTGYVFGSDAFKRFTQNNNINLLVRGHECVDQGYQFLFGERLVTVFSASKYCGCAHNSAGIIQLANGLNPVAIEFQPMEYIERDMVTFYDI